MSIGIMQGRLLPPEPGLFQAFPRERWREEFSLAAAAGLESIEWIYDTHGADTNPLNTDAGIEEMLGLAAHHSVSIDSLCADCFMDQLFVKLPGRLSWLIERCHRARIGRIVLPFVDSSQMKSSEEIDLVTQLLRTVLPEAARLRVEIHLETNLAPIEFRAMLNKLPSPWLKANYDSGNSASLGYRPAEECAAYGGRIGSVHIKDRARGGGTKPLGSGDTDFPELFQALRHIGFDGDYVLQVAREDPGNELDAARRNVAFVRGFLANE